MMDVRGEWQVDGTELTLITPLGLETYQIEGDKLTKNGREVWVKK